MLVAEDGPGASLPAVVHLWRLISEVAWIEASPPVAEVADLRAPGGVLGTGSDEGNDVQEECSLGGGACLPQVGVLLGFELSGQLVTIG